LRATHYLRFPAAMRLMALVRHIADMILWRIDTLLGNSCNINARSSRTTVFSIRSVQSSYKEDN
jgi:hypothetical protein